MRRPALAAVLALVVLVAVVALLASGQPERPPVAVSPTPTPSPRPTASPSPAAVLDERFGFVFHYNNGSPNFASSRSDAIRQESDPRPTHDLAGLGRNVILDRGLAVSPDGRRLAYWTMTTGPSSGFPFELRVLDVTPGARPRTLLTLEQVFGELGDSVVWSSDGTGLVIGVVRYGSGPGAGAPPDYSAVRLLDAAGGQPREIARIRGGPLVPIAWDRQVRLVAAFEDGGGSLNAYDVIEEGGTLERTQMNIMCVRVEASHDAKRVLAHGLCDGVLRVWPLASPARAVELRPPGGERILAGARWRPGTAEIGVVFDDRLELWDAGGARRLVPLPPLPHTRGMGRTFFFRADGSAAFVGGDFLRSLDGRPTPIYGAVELASGRSAVIPGPDEDWLLSASVRIGP